MYLLLLVQRPIDHPPQGAARPLGAGDTDPAAAPFPAHVPE